MIRDKRERAKATKNPSVLQKLASHPDYRVRQAVARNHNTPLTTLTLLVQSEVMLSDEERLAILNSGSPAIPKHVIESQLVSAATAENPNATMDLLKTLVQRGHVEDVARRKNLSKDVVEAFRSASRQRIFSWLQRIAYSDWRSDLRDYNESVINLIADLDDDVRRFGARDGQLMLQYRVHPERTNRPAGETIREVLARCKAIPERALLTLARTQNPDVHWALVTNTSVMSESVLPRDVALALSKSEDWRVLLRLESCSSLTADEKLAITQRRKEHPAFQAMATQPTEEPTTAKHAPEPVLDSPAEEVFWRAVLRGKHQELEGVVTQFQVGRYRVDFALPDERIGIEIDGFRYHSSQADIVSDRQRQRALEQAKWRVVRFAAKEVFDDPDGCVRQAAAWIRAQGS